MQTLTYSAIRTFLECPRRYLLRYLMNLVPLAPTPHPLHFGALFHRAIAKLYETCQPKPALELINSFPDATAYDRISLYVMLSAYADRYISEFAPTHQPQIERIFRLPLVNPLTGRTSRSFLLSGKTDMVTDSTLWEHKTSASINGRLLDTLWTDFQIRFYCSCLRQTGIPIDRILYNLVLKPPIRWRKGETPDQFESRLNRIYRGKETNTKGEPYECFVRHQILFDAQLDRDIQLHTWQAAASILANHWEEHRHLPPKTIDHIPEHRRLITTPAWAQNPMSCRRRAYSDCPYLNLCSSRYNPAVLDNDYTYEEPHQELKHTGELNEPDHAPF